MVEMFYDWDFGEAEQRLARAVLLDPSYAPAHQLQAELYAVTGRFDASVAALERARRLDPLSLSIGRDIGRLAYYRRDFPAAAAALQRTLELDGTFTPARFVLAFSLSLAGDHKAALLEFERMDRSPMRGLMRAAHAYELAQVGRGEEAIRLVRELEEATLDTSSLVRPYDVALAHAGLGDVEATLSWLEEARAQRSYRIVYLGVDPVFDRLRGDRRFTTLLSSLGLGVLAGPLATSAQSVPPAAPRVR
jgi:serine/threonine-protein kinase